MHYAARRAAHTGGRVAMLYVIEPAELQHFLAIEELAREERREAAEELLQRSVRGDRADRRLDADRLYPRGPPARRAAGADQRGAGDLDPGAGGRHRPGGAGAADLVSTTGKLAARLRIPITIVPGGLSLDQVDQLS